MSLENNKFLNDEEFSKLKALIEKLLKNPIKSKSYRNGLLISISMNCCARPQEVLNITPLNISKKSITIQGLKGSKDRTIPLPNKLIKQIHKFITTHGIIKNTRIFNITGRQYRRIWNEHVSSNQNNKSLKSLRHTGALKIYKNCKDIRCVQYVLGHKSITNTMVYMDYVENQESLETKINGMQKQKLNF